MERLIETEASFLDVYDNTGNAFFEEILKRCVAEISGQLHVKPAIHVFGRLCHQQRNVGFFSNESKGYSYSKQFSKSMPLTPSLDLLLDHVNQQFGSSFNGILVNYYEDGTNVIGAHSDDEKGLDATGVVAISYGAPRKFRIREKGGKPILLDVSTKHLQMIHMGGDFQNEFTHEIPKEMKVKEGRYSFTFRKHLE